MFRFPSSETKSLITRSWHDRLGGGGGVCVCVSCAKSDEGNKLWRVRQPTRSPTRCTWARIGPEINELIISIRSAGGQRAVLATGCSIYTAGKTIRVDDTHTHTHPHAHDVLYIICISVYPADGIGRHTALFVFYCAIQYNCAPPTWCTPNEKYRHGSQSISFYS